MMPVPSSEPTNIRSHGTTFCCLMDLVPGIYESLYFDYKIELEKLGRIAITHRTHRRFAAILDGNPKQETVLWSRRRRCKDNIKI
jgi:hypothetical protein